jgi:hypothetical protein
MAETAHWVLFALYVSKRSHAQRDVDPQGLFNALVLRPACRREQSVQANREKKAAIEPRDTCKNPTSARTVRVEPQEDQVDISMCTNGSNSGHGLRLVTRNIKKRKVFGVPHTAHPTRISGLMRRKT